MSIKRSKDAGMIFGRLDFSRRKRILTAVMGVAPHRTVKKLIEPK